MRHWILVLASLLALGCGSSASMIAPAGPPSPTDPPGPGGSGGAVSPAVSSRPITVGAATNPPQGAPQEIAAGDDPSPRLDGAQPGHGSVNQTFVATKEPLGGTLTQEDIRKIVEQSGDVFGDCYTLGAGGKMKDFRGKVTVKATIGPKGTVNVAQVMKSTGSTSQVDSCVVEAFKKVKFPPPKDGGTTVITFPIAFEGVQQVQ